MCKDRKGGTGRIAEIVRDAEAASAAGMVGIHFRNSAALVRDSQAARVELPTDA